VRSLILIIHPAFVLVFGWSCVKILKKRRANTVRPYDNIGFPKTVCVFHLQDNIGFVRGNAFSAGRPVTVRFSKNAHGTILFCHNLFYNKKQDLKRLDKLSLALKYASNKKTAEINPAVPLINFY